MEPESVSPGGGGQDAGPRAAAGADSKQLPSLLESVLIGGSMRDPPRTLPRTADGVNRSQALGEVSYQLPPYAHAPQTHMVSRSWGAATVPPHSAYPHGGLTAPFHRHRVLCTPCCWEPQTQAAKPIGDPEVLPCQCWGSMQLDTLDPHPGFDQDWSHPSQRPGLETLGEPQSEGHPEIAGTSSVLRAG